MSFAEEIADAGLRIKAIKLNPNNPFTWASGYRMPIYNDNRMFLFYPRHRGLIVDSFKKVIEGSQIIDDVIAGTSTAGIPWASMLSGESIPLIYIRDKPKDHGLKNQIEGIDAESDLGKGRVLLIEDLISTGGSSARAVQAIRDANGICVDCLSVFNYGFNAAERVFNGEDPYDKEGNKLDHPCEVRSLLDYDTLLEVARDTRYINDQQAAMLAEWRADPFNWGERHGFPKVER